MMRVWPDPASIPMTITVQCVRCGTCGDPRHYFKGVVMKDGTYGMICKERKRCDAIWKAKQ